MDNKKIFKHLNSIEKFNNYSKISILYEKDKKNKTLKSLIYSLKHPHYYKEKDFLKELAKKYPYETDNCHLIIRKESPEVLSKDKKEQIKRFSILSKIINLTKERIIKKKKENKVLIDQFSYHPKYEYIDKNVPCFRMKNPTYREKIIRKIKDDNYCKKYHTAIYDKKKEFKKKIYSCEKKINTGKFIKINNIIPSISPKTHCKTKTYTSSFVYSNNDMISTRTNYNIKFKKKINENIKNIFTITNKTESNLYTNTCSNTTEKDINENNLIKEKNKNDFMNTFPYKKIIREKKMKYNTNYKPENKGLLYNFNKMTSRQENPLIKTNKLNNPDSAYYSPNYDYINERSKTTIFGYQPKNMIKYKKYLLKKLWGSYQDTGKTYYLIDNNKLN